MSSRPYAQQPGSTAFYPSRQPAFSSEPPHDPAAYERARRAYAEPAREPTRNPRGAPSSATRFPSAPSAPAGAAYPGAYPGVYASPAPLSHLATPPTAPQSQQYRVAGLEYAPPRTAHGVPEQAYPAQPQARGVPAHPAPAEIASGIPGLPPNTAVRRQEGGDYTAMASERERARDEQLRRARAEERKAEQDRHQQELDHAQARRRETRRAQRSPQDARVFTGREGESSDNAAVRGVGRDSRARDVSTVPRDNPSYRPPTTQSDAQASTMYAAAPSSRTQARPAPAQTTAAPRERYHEPREEFERTGERSAGRRQGNRDHGSGSDTDKGVNGRDRQRSGVAADARGATVSSRAYAVHDQNVPPQETNRNYGPFTPVQRTHDGVVDPRMASSQAADRRLSKYASGAETREYRSPGYDMYPASSDELNNLKSRRPPDADRLTRNHPDSGVRSSDEYQRDPRARARTTSSQAGQSTSKPNLASVDPTLKASQERLHHILQIPVSTGYPQNAVSPSGYISAPEAVPLRSRSSRAQMADSSPVQSSKYREVQGSRGAPAPTSNYPYISTPTSVPKNPSSSRSTYETSAPAIPDASPHKYSQRMSVTPGNPAAMQRADVAMTGPVRPATRLDPPPQVQEYRQAPVKGETNHSRRVDADAPPRQPIRRVPVPSADPAGLSGRTPLAAFIAAPPVSQSHATFTPSAPSPGVNGQLSGAYTTNGEQPGQARPQYSQPGYLPEESPIRSGRPSLEQRTSGRQLSASRLPETQASMSRDGAHSGREGSAAVPRESPGYSRPIDLLGPAAVASTQSSPSRPVGSSPYASVGGYHGNRPGNGVPVVPVDIDLERRAISGAARAQPPVPAGVRAPPLAKPSKSSKGDGRTSMLEKAAAAVLSRVRSVSASQASPLSAMAHSMGPAPTAAQPGSRAAPSPANKAVVPPSAPIPVSFPSDPRDIQPRPSAAEDTQPSTPSTGRTGSSKSRLYHTPPTVPVGITIGTPAAVTGVLGQRGPPTKATEDTFQVRQGPNVGTPTLPIASRFASKPLGTSQQTPTSNASPYGIPQPSMPSQQPTPPDPTASGRRFSSRDTPAGILYHHPPANTATPTPALTVPASALPSRPSFTNTQSYVSSLNTPSSLTLQADVSILPQQNPPAQPGDASARRGEPPALATPRGGPIPPLSGGDSREPSVRAPSPSAPSISSQHALARYSSAPPPASSQVSLASRKKGSVFSRIFRPSKTSSKEPPTGPPLSRITSDNTGTRKLIRKPSKAKGPPPAPQPVSTRTGSRPIVSGPGPSVSATGRPPISRPIAVPPNPEQPSPGQHRRSIVPQGALVGGLASQVSSSQYVRPVEQPSPESPPPAPSARNERVEQGRSPSSPLRIDERPSGYGVAVAPSNSPPEQSRYEPSSAQRPRVGRLRSTSASGDQARKNAPPALRMPTTSAQFADKKSPIKSAFAMRFLVSSHKRHRTVSSASLEALDGTRHTLQTTPSTSTLTASVAGPPSAFQQRDTVNATQTWRNNEEVQPGVRGKGGRRRPGVTWDVVDDPPDDEMETRGKRGSLVPRARRPSQ